MIAPSPALRCSFLLFASLLLLFLLRTHFQTFSPSGRSNPDLKISVLETKGCHDEVSASFFSAFGQLPECEVDGYLEAKRFGIEAIYDQLPGIKRRNVSSRLEFAPTSYEECRSKPDIVVSITSEYDMVDKSVAPTFTYLFEKTDCILFAVVHHPDEWKGEEHLEAARPWIEAKRLRFITLSNHVSNYMVATIVNKWGKSVDVSNLHVSTFPPVFTIPALYANETRADEDEKVRFAMQGDLVVNRNPNRDYTGTFKSFARLLGEKDGDSLELRVLGNGGIPKVPKEANNSIKFDVALPYPEFYQVLHSATALLPAFASQDYLRSKASSTIPASFVAGAPLIAGDDLLAAYTFVSKDDVYYREKDEDEIDVIARIAALSEEERLEKSRNLRRKNELVTRETSDLLRFWMSQSFVERDLR